MERDIRCELVSWDEVRGMTLTLAQRLRVESYTPDIIVAIGRGGWIPGRLLSDYLSVANLTDVKVEHYRGTEKQAVARIRYPLRADLTGQRVLVVDDVTDTGDSFAAALEHIHSCGEPADLRTLVLHHKRVSPYVPDYFAQEVAEWRWIVYPWAVVEDLSVMIADMRDPTASTAEVAERLFHEHGIRVSFHEIEEILDLMRPQSNPKTIKAGSVLR